MKLVNKLRPWVSAKDIILEVLRRLSVKGGMGKVIEYNGPGVDSLSVMERATITNMGAELGATTSIFPSDGVTKDFLVAQGRGEQWVELLPALDAVYDEEIVLDLAMLEPMAACPHSPDAVKTIREIGAMEVDQVAIGSCTNSSYADLMQVAALLRGKKVHDRVSLVISPGSKQVLEMLARNGALADLIAAGARILESACGPCIGMGQSPPSGAVSVRTFNRNFPGRSGTADARVYLTGPAAAAAAALTGRLIDPGKLGEYKKVELPSKYIIDDRMIISPPENPEAVEVLRGPNIKALPVNCELTEEITAKVLLKVEDNITTDHIMPAGAKILPLRSNIPAISEHLFSALDPDFAGRAKEAGPGIIVGGHNYGQGSSREHAALAPMYLGIKAVLAKSFARIHRANLINFGILPLTFIYEEDYGSIEKEDLLAIKALRSQLQAGDRIEMINLRTGSSFQVSHGLTARQQAIILEGGLLNYTKKQNG